MESITAAEIYVFYQRNKKTFKTQHDLARGCLAEKLGISSTNKSKEVKIKEINDRMYQTCFVSQCSATKATNFHQIIQIYIPKEK